MLSRTVNAAVWPSLTAAASSIGSVGVSSPSLAAEDYSEHEPDVAV